MTTKNKDTQCFCKSSNYVRPAPILMSLPKKHAKLISESVPKPTMTTKMLKSKEISSLSSQSVMPIAEALPTNKTDSDQHSARQPIPINCWPYKITFSLLPVIYIDGVEFRSPSRSLMVIGTSTDGSPSIGFVSLTHTWVMRLSDVLQDSQRPCWILIQWVTLLVICFSDRGTRILCFVIARSRCYNLTFDSSTRVSHHDTH